MPRYATLRNDNTGQKKRIVQLKKRPIASELNLRLKKKIIVT